MMGRPNLYDRESQVTLRVYVDKDIRDKFKEYCSDNDTSIQEALEEYVFYLLNKNRGEHYGISE